MVEPEHFAEAFLEAAPDSVLCVDSTGLIVLVNGQTERFLGYPRQQLWGMPLEDLLAANPAQPGEPLEVPPSRPASPRAVELYAKRRDGSWVPVEVSLAPVQVSGRSFSIAILRDLTERRRRESDLIYISTHDRLTGLLNRFAFDEALQRLDKLGPHPVGVVMVDLDELKRVNDDKGHAAGDTMLRRVAEVLRATFRADDVVARIGGDEFAVLTAGKDATSVSLLANRLLDALAAHNREHDEAPLKLSIGVAVAESGGSIAAALHDADARMYSMKRLHHGG
jgi:diguanylate cyclase (GGDEF)-like protein/PAS domain S-box-containing protein